MGRNENEHYVTGVNSKIENRRVKEEGKERISFRRRREFERTVTAARI